MKDQHKTDKFFKENLEEREFEFKESYWESAQKLLDEDGDSDSTGASPFPYGRGILLGIIVLLIPAMMYWVNYDVKEEINTTTEISPDRFSVEPPLKTVKEKPFTNNNSNKKELNLEPQQTVENANIRNKDTKDSFAGLKPELEKSKQNNEIKDSFADSKLEPKKSKQNKEEYKLADYDDYGYGYDESDIVEVVYPDVAPVPNSEYSETINSDSAINQETFSVENNSHNQIKESITLPENTADTQQNASSSSETTDALTTSTNAQKPNSKEVSIPEELNSVPGNSFSDPPVLIDLSANSDEATDEAPTSMDLDQLTAANLGHDILVVEDNTTKIRSLTALELIAQPNQQRSQSVINSLLRFPFDEEAREKFAEQVKKRDHRHAVGFTLGSTLSLGFTSGGSASTSISTFPVFGLTYSYRVSPKLRFHTGLAYQARGGLNGEYEYITRQYGFGSTQTSVVLNPKSLHFVEVPAFATYRVYNRHYIQLGASMAYLLNVASRENSQTPTGPEESKSVWGFKQGFSNYDLQLRLGYGYYLGKGFTLNAEAAMGMIDLTDDAFFQNTRKDRNMQFRLRLAYDLFSF